jgi:hypothetical protein
VFLVLSGSLTIRMDDGDVTLAPGQLYVVPKGTPHQPFSEDGAEVLLVEPSARGPVVDGDGPARRAVLRRRALPTAARVGPVAGNDLQGVYAPERSFEFGLEGLLDGVDVLILDASR